MKHYSVSDLESVLERHKNYLSSKKIVRLQDGVELKMLRNKKGLSPVVSAIILIAVTVAVAIAATTWLGSMTLGFMEVDQITITSHAWATDSSYIDLTIQNYGTTSATIIDVQVNKETASSASYSSGDSTLSPEETTTLRITHTFTPSRQYEFTVITSSGIKLIHAATAPSGPSKIWYDQSWNRRREITIDNSLSSEDIVDYQLRLNIVYDSDMLCDFSDLRFTSNDKQTTIPTGSKTMFLQIMQRYG